MNLFCCEILLLIQKKKFVACKSNLFQSIYVRENVVSVYFFIFHSGEEGDLHDTKSRSLLFYFKVFVRWIFVTVDLHIGYMSLFWCDWSTNCLKNRLNENVSA